MIEKFRLVDNETIVFYLNYNYEIGEIGGSKTPILDNIKTMIQKINFEGKKIILMVGTVAIATLMFTGSDFKGNIINDVNVDYNVPTVEEIVDLENTSLSENIIEELVEDSVIKEVVEDNVSNGFVNNENIVVSKMNNPNTSSSSSVSSGSINNQNSTVSDSQTTGLETVEEETITEAKTMVTVYRSNGQIINIELEEYIVGVVAAEMPASFNIEALKAQAVVARTYTLKRINSGLKLTDTVSTQSYIDIDQMKTMWGSSFTQYYNKIVDSVSQTSGKYITYNGQYIDAVYHSTSNGYTEDSISVWGNSVAYLKSVESSYDISASSYLRTETKSYSTILDILGIEISSETSIEIVNRNASGRVVEVKIDGNTYSGIDLRTLLGLRSTDFEISFLDGNLVFTTRGYGHGVGMSQYGANGMANAGYSYLNILQHYYQGVTIQ
ncbi:MAG: stage II sporulation protein D [Bacilli bacterium]